MLRRFATLVLILGASLTAQRPHRIEMVPLIRYSGTLPVTSTSGAAGIVFSIYRDEFDGAPLWSEIQNVRPDDKGHYSVLLGTTRNEGLPPELFNTSEPRWLEVEINGVKEPRELLGSVPYALVAGNAQTLGGLPPSAYLRAETQTTSTTNTVVVRDRPTPAATLGTPNYLGVFTNATDLGNSVIYQTGNAVSIGGTNNLGAMTLIGNAPSGDTPGMALYNSGGGGGASVSLDMYNTYANGGIPQAKIKALDDGAFSDHLTFWTKIPGAANNPVAERVRITSAGNVGIGTANPAAALDVAGSINVSGTVTVGGLGNAITFADGTKLTSAAPAAAPNLSAIAQLRWGYNNASTFPVSIHPARMVFDGTSIWALDNSGGNVVKISTATGSAVGTYSFGTRPSGIAFDGTNIWIADSTASSVTKVVASTGAIVGSFYAGQSPGNLAFDGTNIWALNGNSSVTKLSASTGSIVGTYPTGAGPSDICFDGANIWIANFGGGNVTKLLASNGSTVGTYALGGIPVGIAFDGSNIWVTSNSNVVKLVAATGSIAGRYPAGILPTRIAFDGANIWLVDSIGNSVVKLLVATGANLGSFAVGSLPSSVLFDGSNIWVSNGGDSTLTKVSPSAK